MFPCFRVTRGWAQVTSQMWMVAIDRVQLLQLLDHKLPTLLLLITSPPSTSKIFHRTRRSAIHVSFCTSSILTASLRSTLNPSRLRHHLHFTSAVLPAQLTTLIHSPPRPQTNPQEPLTMGAPKSNTLTPRDLEVVAWAWQCLKTEPQVRHLPLPHLLSPRHQTAD